MEARIYENDYVREDGVWKIKRLDYMMQWQGEYELGWSKTISHLQPLDTTFPENPIGPDEIRNGDIRKTWPFRHDVPMHFAHPKFNSRFNSDNLKLFFDRLLESPFLKVFSISI